MFFVESYRKLTRVPEPEKKWFRITGLFERVRILYNSLENNDRAELMFSIENPDP